MVAKRGCGTRIQGGIYLSVPLGAKGRPVEDFIIDPPVRIDAEGMGVSARGTSLLERNGATHVIDWVGSNNYPNVADFIEETKRMGISRRISKQTDFSKLDSRSMLMLCHSQAWITNHHLYRINDGIRCIRNIPGHENLAEMVTGDELWQTEMCASLWWHDIVDGDPILDPAVPYRTVRRQIGDISYVARRAPDDVGTEHELAMFFAVQVPVIEVVMDKSGGLHEAAYDAAKRSGLHVELVDE